MTGYIRRPADTWRLVAQLGHSLTTPHIDPDRDDPAVDEMLAGSVFGRMSAAVLSTMTAAWRTSLLRAAVANTTAAIAPLDAADRVRCAGLVVLVAAGVALAGRFAAASPGRFTWAVPAAAAVVGLLLMAMPVPVARALGDRRR